MGLFDHFGDEIRLQDREPEKKKKKKKREVRPYKPLRPLSWVGCALVFLVAGAMFCYAAATLAVRFAGVEAEAAANTRLVDGAVVDVPVTGITTTLQFTFRDAAGKLHGGIASLVGNTQPFGETVTIRYVSFWPALNMLSSNTERIMIPLGCLLLGAIFVSVGVKRIRELKAEGDRSRGSE